MTTFGNGLGRRSWSSALAEKLALCLFQLFSIAPPDIGFRDEAEHMTIGRQHGKFIGACFIEIRHHCGYVHIRRQRHVVP